MTRATTRRLIVQHRKDFKDISDYFIPECVDLIKDTSDRKYITDVVLPMVRSSGKEQRVRVEATAANGYDNERVKRVMRETAQAAAEDAKRIAEILSERGIH
ncbi:hypothetical protein [Mesorhizobium sp. B4-1-4]|uniref:hypothetical protein n=1 Tax=Mesorhizobium sp. B4-1-4 TaxID=2589888 RepID=UPI00112B4ED2|nr:hypothetical protein [Mesorhizobium sp. B4-1-4]UCI30507.1 hypothetical protein FJW03_22250 [Mesorhizobium sp. B4-1-4]